MTGMKITVDAAMRARDVSRPHAEHDELAQASEADQTGSRRHTPPASGTRSRDSNSAIQATATDADATNTAEAAEVSTATTTQGRGRRRRKRH